MTAAKNTLYNIPLPLSGFFYSNDTVKTRREGIKEEWSCPSFVDLPLTFVISFILTSLPSFSHFPLSL